MAISTKMNWLKIAGNRIKKSVKAFAVSNYFDVKLRK